MRPGLSGHPEQARLGLWEQGFPAKSEPYFARAVELRPDDWIIRNNLGLAYWDQGRPLEAAECYRQVLELNPARTTPG